MFLCLATEVISSTPYIWQLYVSRMDWLHIYLFCLHRRAIVVDTVPLYPIPHSYPHLEKFWSFLLNTQLGWMNGAMQWLHSKFWSFLLNTQLGWMNGAMQWLHSKFWPFLLNTQLGWMNGAVQWLHSDNQICRSLNPFWLPWFHTIGQFH